jgi:hypothetical protein
MKIRDEERRVKKEFAKKIIKENPQLSEKELLIKLMGEFNMSRRYTKEYLDVALFEIKNG